ncbi:facilitated trehalose transporter Tret1 [Hyalella azteca]|uniref:Facilitated trehalose transporter Tret1 n=1 Tax=Hyalella azteca TaxID=294128 RepID=A0A8B7NFC9_HYAAZ|nr:facilitated trehalose transporter Tret1 [Hyalella azteca]
MLTSESPSHLNQYLTTLAVSVVSIGVGAVLGFNSPASYQLRVPVNDTVPVNNTVAVNNTYRNPLSVEHIYVNTAAGSGQAAGYDDEYSSYNAINNNGFPSWKNVINEILFNTTFPSTSSTINNNINNIRSHDLSPLKRIFPSDFSPTYSMGAEDITPTAPSELDDTADIVMSSEQLSWFMSVFALGALVGALGSGALMTHLGKRGALIASTVPCLLGWTMTGLCTAYPALVTGRVLTGVFVGSNAAAASAYVGEIASCDIRGTLGSFYELALVVGILLEMVVGAYTTWQHLALISMCPTIMFVILMFFCKESPAHLLMRGREQEARRNLQHFRGPDYCIDKEIHDVLESQKEAKDASFKLKDLKKPHIYKPLIITLTISVFAQLVGIEVLTSNLSTIFKSTGSNMSENLSSVICILVEIVAGVVAIFLVDRVGRKTLLTVSSAVMTVSLGSLGLYFYLLEESENWEPSQLAWLPLTAIMTYVMAYGTGFGPVIWILVGEMFPPLVRETAAGLTVTALWTTSFLTVQSYDLLMEGLQSYGFYWFYAGVCALATLFSLTIVRETRGKTLEEITQLFMRAAPTLGAARAEDL